MAYIAEASIVIQAQLERVWMALTVPQEVKQYFFNTDMVTDWKVGSPILFRGEWEGKPYEDKGTVLEFYPMQTFSYDYWSASSGLEDKPGLYQTLRFDLTEVDDGILVSITQSNVDAVEKAEQYSKNWKMVLEALKKFVEEG